MDISKLEFSQDTITADGVVYRREGGAASANAAPAGRSQSTIAGVATGQSGGMGTSPAAGSSASAGGSQFLLGTVSPDANGNLPALFVSEGGELKINWPPNSEAYLPLNVSSGLPQGTKVSIKTYGVPDTGSEIYACLSATRAQFDSKNRTVDNTFRGIIAEDEPGYVRMDAGSKLFLNLGGKANDGYTAVQVTIQAP